MKKTLLLVLSIGAVLGIASSWANRHGLPIESYKGPQPTGVTGAAAWTTQTIDFAGKKPTENLTWQIQPGDTALSLLQRRKAVDVKTYDFGTAVEAIDGVWNNTTSKQYWIYYVNGKPATVAADKYVLQKGDTLEWKFEAAK